jgi:hypothetical protein
MAFENINLHEGEKMGSKTFDEVYLNILREKKTLPSFLDSVFGFLYRWYGDSVP